MLKEVKIELTNKCSRNCKHCSNSDTSDNKNLKELDFNHVSKIIRKSKLMGGRNYSVMGVEPLMYERLCGLIKLTSSLGLKSTIYSFVYINDKTLNQYSIYKSGCIGQKIIANYTQDADKVKVLRRCINSRDLKCMR